MKHLDKLHHIVYSFALAIAGAFLFGAGWGIALAFIVGLGKEVWWDHALGRGTPDLADMAANVVGILGAAFVLGRWGV